MSPIFLPGLLMLLFRFPFLIYAQSSYRVVWDVPTDACAKRGINLTSSLVQAGVEVNTGGVFRGNRIVLLYDPGVFPSLDQGQPVNGGVPQEGDLQEHLTALAADVQKAIPDPDFDGLGIIDFESWRPVWRQNWGTLDVYRKYSIDIERKRHPMWTSDMLEKSAKQRFEKSGVEFMSRTLKECKRLRPKAKWGYYGFPKCYNFTPNNNRMQCTSQAEEDNERSKWLIKDSGALYPSVYLQSKELSEAKRAKLIQGRVEEARRVSLGLPIYPYASIKYQDTKKFVSKADMNSNLLVPRRYGASGVILWGSSKDVNTPEKCEEMSTFIKEVLTSSMAALSAATNKILIS